MTRFGMSSAHATALLLAAVALGQPTAAQSFRKNQPPRVAVDASVSGPITSAPQSIEVSIAVRPHPGIHVYAPGNPDYIAIAPTVFPVEGLKPAAPVFPDAEPYFFAPLKQSVKVYAKPFVIRVPVEVSAAFAKSRRTGSAGDVELKGLIDYQACDDKVCFPPQSIPFSVQVPVKLKRRPGVAQGSDAGEKS